MDNMEKLYREFVKEKGEKIFGYSVEKPSYYYGEDFCEWLADKLEESRNETNKKS